MFGLLMGEGVPRFSARVSQGLLGLPSGRRNRLERFLAGCSNCLDGFLAGCRNRLDGLHQDLRAHVQVVLLL